MQSNSPIKLTPARKKLIEMISEIDFGHIGCFPVRNGEPVLDPKPVVKFRDKIGTPPERARSPFAGGKLRPHFVDTLQRIESLGNGTVDIIEIKHGQPFIMERIPAQQG